MPDQRRKREVQGGEKRPRGLAVRVLLKERKEKGLLYKTYERKTK
jgi:hypothetical protein